MNEWLKQKSVIGMIHLQALPGAPGYGGNYSAIIDQAIADADALATGGCHALMLENFGDVPFFPGRVPTPVVTMMTAVAIEIKRRHKIPLGINVLRNDGLSALAVAVASNAQFIRVNVLSGARVTDQGLIQGIAHELMRERAALNAQNIQVLADVDVKHSAPLAPRPVKDEVADVIKRGLADAVIVSGAGTGEPVDERKLAEVKQAAGKTPVLIGSGATTATIKSLMQHATGLIVGTALKKDASPTSPVDPGKVRQFMSAFVRV